MRSRKLTSAPSLHSCDMQRAIDNLCIYTFGNSLFTEKARIYFYRTRLGLPVNQVAAIFDRHPHDINSIAFKLGNKKPDALKRLEVAIDKEYPNYLRRKYANHAHSVAYRVKNSTFNTATGPSLLHAMCF